MTAVRHRRAFTLIELLAVVAIMGIMVSAAVVGLGSAKTAMRLKAATRDMMAMVRRARSVALITQKPVVLYYATQSDGEEKVARVKMKSEKLFSSKQYRGAVHTLDGELVIEEAQAAEAGGGETIEDILSPEEISSEVARGMCLKVLSGDEQLAASVGTEKKRSQISIFSTVDNVARTYGGETVDAQAAVAAAGAEQATETPVSVVFAANGTVEPEHMIWIYPDGSSPEKGLCIHVDRFGEPKCLDKEGE